MALKVSPSQGLWLNVDAEICLGSLLQLEATTGVQIELNVGEERSQSMCHGDLTLLWPLEHLATEPKKDWEMRQAAVL